MDEKLCPLRKRAYKLGSGPGMPRSTSDDFLPCIREKCAWWIEGGPVYCSEGNYMANDCAIVIPDCPLPRMADVVPRAEVEVLIKAAKGYIACEATIFELNAAIAVLEEK
jgi:hypothetical protein